MDKCKESWKQNKSQGMNTFAFLLNFFLNSINNQISRNKILIFMNINRIF